MNPRVPNRFVVPIAVCLVGLALVGAWGQAKEERPAGTVLAPPTLPQIENRTRSLQIVSTGADAAQPTNTRALKITVQNISDKDVVDYAFVKGDGSVLTTSGATTGWSLAPGQTDAMIISLEAGEHSRATLFAALLEDGTGEGDVLEVARMKDYRKGVEQQFRRAAPLLRQANDAPASEQTLAVLENLHARLSALPEESVGGEVSPGMASGSHHAKQFLQWQVKEAKDKVKKGDGVQPRERGVEKLLGNVEKALAKMRRQSSDPGPALQPR